MTSQGYWSTGLWAWKLHPVYIPVICRRESNGKKDGNGFSEDSMIPAARDRKPGLTRGIARSAMVRPLLDLGMRETKLEEAIDLVLERKASLWKAARMGWIGLSNNAWLRLEPSTSRSRSQRKS